MRQGFGLVNFNGNFPIWCTKQWYNQQHNFAQNLVLICVVSPIPEEILGRAQPEAGSLGPKPLVLCSPHTFPRALVSSWVVTGWDEACPPTQDMKKFPRPGRYCLPPKVSLSVSQQFREQVRSQGDHHQTPSRGSLAGRVGGLPDTTCVYQEFQASPGMCGRL